MKTLVFDQKEITYDGTQLAPHWIYKQFDLLGNALVAFIGPGTVPLDHMVDITDVKKKAPIYSPKMLHFLGEFFIDSFDQGILMQHLFVANVYEWLWERGIKGVSRRGNDIYVDGKKLSVSICTKSPVSVLMHYAANIETEGTPVPTRGLLELDIEPLGMAREIVQRFSAELTVVQTARAKASARL